MVLCVEPIFNAAQLKGNVTRSSSHGMSSGYNDPMEKEQEKEDTSNHMFFLENTISICFPPSICELTKLTNNAVGPLVWFSLELSLPPKQKELHRVSFVAHGIEKGSGTTDPLRR